MKSAASADSNTIRLRLGQAVSYSVRNEEPYVRSTNIFNLS